MDNLTDTAPTTFHSVEGPRRRVSPQCETILNHLRRKGSITGVEAAAVYRVRALPRRISDLREAGYHITRQMKVDPTGQRYARYFLPSLVAAE